VEARQVGNCGTRLDIVDSRFVVGSSFTTLPGLRSAKAEPPALEKYYIALGQSPEAIALMKTDPLRFGSKVSKIE
jgi:hypothetical protein